MKRLYVLAAAAVLLTSCSRPLPPQGRWEGVYESPDTLIVARVEVEADGKVRVSAPDLTDLGSQNADDREASRQHLTEGLIAGWEGVTPRAFDFDGSTFRKPGGIAPQMKWDSSRKEMTIIVYLGTRPEIDIPLRGVTDFSDNPWAS